MTRRRVVVCCVCLLVAGVRAAAQAGAGSDPTAPYFARDHVLDVAVEMAPEDWDRLRAQTRTLQDILGGDDCLAQPVEDIFTWFEAAVTVDGAAYAEVGVRKKGFFGSLSGEKPSLKLRFDKYVDGRLLGGAIDRMTLNNSLQDASMISTCLAYEVFAAAGLPAPRCNFATVTVNGADLGLYVHVEEIKPPFLARHFASVAGNLYEGTLSDFDPGWRGTFEKKTNEDADDWSDVDAAVAALQDPSPAGLEALDAIVDVDRFLSFWATEVLVGHWDGYAGNRNNYHFYREPDGRFVFIPWGVDAVFETTDVPFDDFESPPSVNAHGVLAHRLYRDEAGRAAYAGRLRELLDAVWDEEELLRSAGELAAVVQAHAPPEAREEAADDAARVRRFILKRRGELLADLEPEPPDWPWPLVDAVDVCWGEGSGVMTFEVAFKTTWGTKDSPNPFETGTITSLALDGTDQPPGTAGATAGLANAEEAAEAGLEDGAFLSVMRLAADFSIAGFTVWLPVDLLSAGTELTIGEGGVGGVQWTMPPGAAAPEDVRPDRGGHAGVGRGRDGTGGGDLGPALRRLRVRRSTRGRCRCYDRSGHRGTGHQRGSRTGRPARLGGAVQRCRCRPCPGGLRDRRRPEGRRQARPVSGGPRDPGGRLSPRGAGQGRLAGLCPGQGRGIRHLDGRRRLVRVGRLGRGSGRCRHQLRPVAGRHRRLPDREHPHARRSESSRSGRRVAGSSRDVSRAVGLYNHTGATSVAAGTRSWYGKCRCCRPCR